MNEENVGSADAVKSRKTKKTIIAVLIGMCVFVILYFVVTWFVDFETLFNKEPAYNPTKQTFSFADIDYDENIFENMTYMNMDRWIHLSDPDWGSTTAIDPDTDDYSEYNEDIVFLVGFIKSIIAGDHETYNACFSDNYYLENEKVREFTMQKLYNITIIKEEIGDVTENGVTYTKYEYYLDYMISRNNGTFRRDIESDAIRRQYIVMTDKSGEILIDSIDTNETIKAK